MSYSVAVVLEHRFFSTPDGSVWTDSTFPVSFWQRYLSVFDKVKPVARIQAAETPADTWLRADGPGIEFQSVAHYHGPRDFVRRRREVLRSVKQGLAGADAVILRVPGTLGTLAGRVLRRQQRAYGVEVVGDPYDAFSPGASAHPLRAAFRYVLSRQLRHDCRGAAMAAYVTEHALQERYPPSPDAYTTHYSSVELRPEAFASSPRTAATFRDPLTAVFAGGIDHLYKAPDVLIQAFARCCDAGMALRLEVLGDGEHRADLERLADRLGVGDRVAFRGWLPSGEPVRAAYDAADLFVLPSRQEGVPRAMIEALARGLPAIGSTVGGIPELLPASALVPAGDVDALTACLTRVASDPEEMEALARAGFKRAHAYADHELDARRRRGYSALLAVSANEGR